MTDYLKMYSLKIIPYQRKFQRPLKTHHGVWQQREGIVIELETSAGKIGRGEIAPLPWFGTETLNQAQDFCLGFQGKITPEEIIQIPQHFPCCQFAVASAQLELNSPLADDHHSSLTHSFLLPSGAIALDAILTPGVEQYKTFKWKIGVENFASEHQLLIKLLEQLPPKARLRLDANGGLSLTQAQEWLRLSDDLKQIEFLEQPLAPQELSTMLELSQSFKTAIALDESVSNLQDLAQVYDHGWRGIYVLKAAILGSPQRLDQWLQSHPIDAVFSSVFETAIGRRRVLALAQRYNNPQRAVGFGVDHWFVDERS